MQYKFFLNELEIEEPIGWADFELSMQRDDIYHGMQFEVSTSALRFFGVAATYLQEQKLLNGLSSNVTFIAQETCDAAEYETIIEGRLNFGKYKDKCGNFCIVEIPFEEQGCKVTFKNRFDQKVDIDNIIALDKSTVLADYSQLGQTMTMPAVALDARVEGYVKADNTSFGCFLPAGGEDVFYLRPMYGDEKFNAIPNGQLNEGNECNYPFPMTPQVLFDEDLAGKCFNSTLTLEARMKGEYEAIASLSGTLKSVTVDVLLWNGEGVNFAGAINLFQEVLLDVPGLPMDTFNNPFDVNINIPISIDDLTANPGLYVVMTAVTDSTTDGLPGREVIFVANFTNETFFKLSTKKICPDTAVKYYMVHETLSRVTESITNGCIRVKSDFFGRPDSQPFATVADGCGALMMLTSGLMIRNAPDAKFFATAKELIGGLNAIFNLGFSIEPDPDLPNKMLLIIEQVDHFYRDFEILSLNSIAEVENEIQENWHYAQIKVGYKKWETEELNGLHEFNSNREYRTNLETINTVLDITSNLVTGSMPAEVTRQQNFADTGAADTGYDNEIFAFMVNRSAYAYTMEQDRILNPSNIFDPATTLNFYLSPVRNLMRWFKSIVNSYSNITSSTSKLYFNAGTGNFTAAGKYDDSNACSLENNTITENQDIWLLDFANQNQATPLFKNETASFEYPLSISQYNQIKANPYGYISYTCGTSNIVNKGFIKEIKFRPARGMANFTLRKKWGN